ncbi:MAG: VRR-NUC domain-containing protein [Planctomycetota bacterium]
MHDQDAVRTYGRQLLVTLRCAELAAEHARVALFDADERAATRALCACEPAVADAIARLLERRDCAALQRDLALPAHCIAAATASGWLQAVPLDPTDPASVARLTLADLSLPGPKPRALAQARATGELTAVVQLAGPLLSIPRPRRCQVRRARALAFADPTAGAQTWVAHFQGRLDPPPGSEQGRRLARAIAGANGPANALPAGDGSAALLFPDRTAACAWSEARAAREAGTAAPGALVRAFAMVARLRHAPVDPLRYRWSAAYQWQRLLWDCHAGLPAADPRRARIRVLLQRVALPPRLAAALWRECWSTTTARGTRRRLAARLATWPIWTPAEARRWARRASARRTPQRSTPWPVRELRAALDHHPDGSVRAGGLRVEAYALARLRARGWDGLHAEGGFWRRLCDLLLAPTLALPVPGMWPGPLQAAPLDHHRPAFAAHRRSAVTTILATLHADPSAACEQALSHSAIAGPSARAMRAACSHLPGRILAHILETLLACPAAAAGLPDLLTWRDEAVELWEVKSPGDAISDAQADWLERLLALGLSCGELRVLPAAAEQTALPLFDQETANARRRRAQRSQQARPTVRTGRTRERARPRDPGAGLLALVCEPAEVLSMQPGRLCAGLPLEDPPCIAAEELADPDRGRRVTRFAPLPVRAVLLRTATAHRRWVAVDPPLLLPLCVVTRAQASGGVAQSALIPTRPSGWLLAAHHAAREPVLLDRPSCEGLQAGQRSVLGEPPAAVGPRPEDAAERLGCAEALAGQLALLGDEPYALRASPHALELQLHPHASVLWAGGHPRLRRGTLPWRL